MYVVAFYTVVFICTSELNWLFIFLAYWMQALKLIFHRLMRKYDV
jgi:hypothetical protein